MKNILLLLILNFNTPVCFSQTSDLQYHFDKTQIIAHGSDDITRIDIYTSKLTNKADHDKFFKYAGYTFSDYSRLHFNYKIGNQLFYDVYNTTERYGFRKSSKISHNKSSKEVKHLFIAGDSNTYGLGVEDNKTYSSIINQSQSLYHAYNLGIAGSGPNKQLAFLEHFNLHEIASESEGLFIYNFMNNYIHERVIGSKNFTCWDLGFSPWYELENGHAIWRGFLKDRFFTHYFYRIICKTPVLKTLIKNLPRINKEHMELSANILLKMKQEYLRQFPRGVFLIIINNIFNDGYETDEDRYFRERLKQLGVKTITRPAPQNIDEYMFKLDGHFNEFGHRKEAEFILDKVLGIIKG